MTRPKLDLIQAPTPLHRLDRASEALGIDLWIKRDDLTGFALGGNKGRKIEYILGDLMARGVRAVVTCGAAHSNFIRQLAAGCQVAGIECHAAVMVSPFDAAAGRPSFAAPGYGGNWMLSERFGAQLTVFEDDDWEVLYAHADEIAARLGAEVIPVGGSCALGAYAMWLAAKEVEGFRDIVFASSSGSTHVGFQSCFQGTATNVWGIACDPEPEIAHDFVELSRALGFAELGFDDFKLDFDFVGDGYGVPSAAGEAASSFLLRHEGIVLDPVYTAKAFAGLLARKAEFTGKTLFWHTGGIPAVFNPAT